MTGTRWITPILLIAWLLSGCQSNPSTTQILTETEATLPAFDAKQEDDPEMNLKQPYMIGAYYYPWYSPDRHWDSGYLGIPVLGEYDSADPGVINQHITWAVKHDVDFFALSWWGIDSFEDKVILGPFFDTLNNHDFRFAILYESAGLLKLRNGIIDLDNAVVRKQLVSDFSYLAANILQHPNYLTIDGKPVIFLYLTRTFTGDVADALIEAKAAAAAQGSMEPFIIGDEVYWQYPDKERLQFYDGVTAYNMHTSVPDIAEGFAENVDRQYRLWAKIASSQGTAFIPNILPGFNDTAVRPEANHPVIPRSVESFSAQLNTAKELTADENGIIMVTSWNEWHENTSIEPTKEDGTVYLEVLQNTQQP